MSFHNNLQPWYRPQVENAAYQLRYSWTGWPAENNFATQPVRLIDEVRSLWESDQMRVLEYRWNSELVQILFSASPDVSPVFIAARAKGRLDHALRKSGIDLPFSRKISVRSLGENTLRDLEAYVEQQVSKERFVDPRFVRKMQELIVADGQTDLSKPTESAHGRYWYNLHLVLVVEHRAPIASHALLVEVREAFLKVAKSKGHCVSRLAVMPDHLHAVLRGKPTESPLDLIFSYQNNLAYLTRQPQLWSPGFYVGTIGDYSMQAVRNRADLVLPPD